jgi:Tol biopolymer transport system component
MGVREQAIPAANRRAVLLANAPYFLLLMLIAAVTLLKLTGCANRSPAEAEDRETRLTSDEAPKFGPRFSPDGRWLAYTERLSPEKGLFAIYVLPVQGGVPRRLSPDTLAVSALVWSADGQGVYARSYDALSIYLIGLDGSVQLVDRSEGLTRFVTVSPDGKQQLVLKFNGDNRDLAFRQKGGKFEYLAESPAWEEDAVFGPGPGEVTAVAAPSFQGPVRTISIWSPKTRAYTPLPLPEGLNYQPAWSPGGHHLAFTSYRGGQSDLWVFDTEKARAVQVTNDPENVGCPGWSPDRRWLVFCRTVTTSHLFAGMPGEGKPRQLTDGPAQDYSPMVSFDGKWVAFVRSAAAGSAPQQGPSLCVIPAAGGPVTQLDLKGLNLAGKSESFNWSRDGRQLAIQATDASGQTDVYRIGRDGQGLTRVTVEPGEEVEPKWSPDGRYISYTQAAGGRTEVGVIPANGGLPRVVSEPAALSEGGTWAEDSDHLAYLRIPKEGIFEIWVTSLSHPKEAKRVIEDKLMAYPVGWSRDDQQLLLVRGSGSKWFYTALSLATGQETRIGDEVILPSGKSSYVKLTAAGEKHRNFFYPGGVNVFADGEERTDLYRIQARTLLESRLAATRAK